MVKHGLNEKEEDSCMTVEEFLESIKGSLPQGDATLSRFTEFEKLYRDVYAFFKSSIKLNSSALTSMDDLYKVYLAIKFEEKKKDVLPLSQFIWSLSSYCNAIDSEPYNLSAPSVTAISLPLCRILLAKTEPVVNYYKKKISARVLSKVIKEQDLWNDFDKEATGIFVNTECRQVFVAKYGSLYSIYNRDYFCKSVEAESTGTGSAEVECAETESTETESTETESTETESEETASGETECVGTASGETECVGTASEELISVPEDDSQTAMKERLTFKRFRKQFTPGVYIAPIVSTILCDGRHDVEGVPECKVNSPAIFKTLERGQMSDFAWMEATVKNWVGKNLKFDENGKPLQELRVYTTGYNPLNACVLKECFERRINLYNMYYDKSENAYQEHKIIDYEKPEEGKLRDSRLARYSDWYLYSDDSTIDGDFYAMELCVKQEEVLRYVFLTASAEAAMSWYSCISPSILQHEYHAKLKHYVKKVRKDQSSTMVVWETFMSADMVKYVEEEAK